MNEIRNELAANPLKTRADAVRAAAAILRPLPDCLTPGRARMIVGDSGAVYSEDVAGMEGWSRVLWGLVPMWMGGCPEAEPYWKLWREGLVHGTDPEHPEYWGDIHDFDQRMVEMAVLGIALCFLPDRFWNGLSPREQDNLYAWLNQINQYDMPKNNWRFFRILVNTGFRRVGRLPDASRLTEDLDMMEEHYVGDGWYFDYETKRDYYTIWAFHFYSLVYVAAMKDEDPERCRRFRERARLIAPRFACWFDREGRALPYGRSLTYRFCQSAFWAAMAFSDTDCPELGWGGMKHLWLGNLRSWLKMPVFDRGGCLTVGYGYPNLIAAEGYNAPGSPYWALKTFFALAVPESHPFWQAEEKEVSLPAVFLDPQVRLLLTRDPENRQVVAYTAGNHGWEHMHEDEKYEKFAYSTHFGFSVTKESTTLSKGAYDSMLAVKRAGRDLWHVRSGCEAFDLREDRISCEWSPMEGVRIRTVVAPCGMWHVRKHVVTADCALEAAEGAFAVRADWAGERPCDRIASVRISGENMAAARGAFGTSAVFALKGYSRGEAVGAEPNTNLVWPRTVLPMLRADLEPGTHELVCAVYADTQDRCPEKVPEEVLKLAGSL